VAGLGAKIAVQVLDGNPEFGDAMRGRQAERVVGRIEHRLGGRHAGVHGFGDDRHAAPGEPFVDRDRHRGPEIGDVALVERVEIAPVQRLVGEAAPEGQIAHEARHAGAHGKPGRRLAVEPGGDEIGAITRGDRGGKDRPAGPPDAHRLARIRHQRANRPAGMDAGRGGNRRPFRQDEMARHGNGHGQRLQRHHLSLTRGRGDLKA
jgi:hypothetical protein